MHGGEDFSLSLPFRLVGSICVSVGQIVLKNQFMIDLGVGELGGGSRQGGGGKLNTPH